MTNGHSFRVVRRLFRCACCIMVALSLFDTTAADRSSVDTSKLPPPAQSNVDFARDIQPLLSKHCYDCHGADKQKSGLRLDRKADALTGGDSGKVIIPGKSSESRLIHLVAGIDPDNVMPPKGAPLSGAEIGRLRAWIDSGATWPETANATPERRVEHWAFNRAQSIAPPSVRNSNWVRNAVDAFVLARLEREKVAPSPEADRRTLIRRLSLDLLGLPPTPEEVHAFVSDERPDAYERLLDRLLASPHFGEQWGRHWLDLARYGDSDGYEKDGPRPYAYLFRDWVIEAINSDQPFDQFTIEQIAGDLLPNAGEKQKVATGFHRQTLTNREGGVDKEEFRSRATVDRVSTTASVWLGLTVACAECHTHKYDPITQREFYQFYAFFNNASEKDISAPQPAEMADYAKELTQWERKLRKLDRPLQEYLTNVLTNTLPEWERSLKLPTARWTVLKPRKASIATEGDESQLTAAKDGSLSPRAKDPVRSRYTIDVDLPRLPAPAAITGFRIEALAEPGKLAGRGAKGDFALSEFVVMAQTPGGEPRRIPLASAKADTESTNGAAANAIDGDRNTGWSVGAEGAQSHTIVFTTQEPLELQAESKLTFVVEQFTIGLMNRFRLAATTSTEPIEPTTVPDSIVAILDTPADSRTRAQTSMLARYFVEEVDDEGRKLNKDLTAHRAKKPKYPETTAAVLVADERKTHVHIRGDFLRPGDEVQPATLSVLHPFSARGAKPDRLDLARWLVEPANPLTARVTVNHVWKNLFGRALVTSTDDFGTRGDKPSHPDLLDFLASQFSKQPPHGLGWSRKALIRLIVSSATYRQSSDIRPDLIEHDPGNMLLARQNRFRLGAENVRDVYLASSGLLNRDIGGPSIRPPLPADIAALGYANSIKWQESKGTERYRRGLYIFFQRTVPYPMLMTFDAPDSTTACTRREVSNTPLQALTLLNDPVFFECAQSLAAKIMSISGGMEKRLALAFEHCLSRPPEDLELKRLMQLFADQRRLIDAAPDSTAKLIRQEHAQSTEAADNAALVAVCRVIMNLDEFVTRD